MKKVFWFATILAVSSLWFLQESITLPFMHLIILGIVPGTNIELGFIFPLGAILIGTFLLVRWLSQTSEALVEYKTEASHAEKRAAELQAAAQERANEQVADAPALTPEEIETISI